MEDEKTSAVKHAETQDASSSISLLLSFLKFGDEIDLLGPFENVIERIKVKLIEHRYSLTSTYRLPQNLPSGHAIRKLFAQACIPEYARVNFINIDHETSFRYQNEFDNVEALAADFLKEWTSIFAAKETKHVAQGRNSETHHYITDPLTKRRIYIQLWFQGFALKTETTRDQEIRVRVLSVGMRENSIQCNNLLLCLFLPWWTAGNLMGSRQSHGSWVTRYRDTAGERTLHSIFNFNSGPTFKQSNRTLNARFFKKGISWVKFHLRPSQ